MCGIVGFIDSKDNRKNLEDWLTIQSHRGEDSFGAVVESVKEISSTKAISKKTFLENLNSIEISDFVLAHHRKASLGDITIDLAHPVTLNKTYVIHNGTKKAIYEAVTRAKSDTEAIAMLLDEDFNTTKLNKRLLTGAGVVFAQNTMHGLIVFVDGNRSLFVNKERTIVASEPITEGEWLLVEPCFTKYKDLKDFIKNVKVYKKTAVITDDTYGFYPSLCGACDKLHMHVDLQTDLCPKCEIEGKKASYSTYSTYGAYNYTPYKYNSTKAFKKPKWVEKGMLVSAKQVGGIKRVNGTIENIDENDAQRPYHIKVPNVKNSYGHPETFWTNDIECITPTDEILEDVGNLVKNPRVNKYYLFSDDKKTWTFGRLVQNTQWGKQPFLAYLPSKDYSTWFSYVKEDEELNDYMEELI